MSGTHARCLNSAKCRSGCWFCTSVALICMKSDVSGASRVCVCRVTAKEKGVHLFSLFYISLFHLNIISGNSPTITHNGLYRRSPHQSESQASSATKSVGLLIQAVLWDGGGKHARPKERASLRALWSSLLMHSPPSSVASAANLEPLSSYVLKLTSSSRISSYSPSRSAPMSTALRAPRTCMARAR